MGGYPVVVKASVRQWTTKSLESRDNVQHTGWRVDHIIKSTGVKAQVQIDIKLDGSGKFMPNRGVTIFSLCVL